VQAKSQRVTKGRAQKVTNKKKVTKKVPNKKKATYFMKDPNGDEGWFTGFVDAKGQANGIGKLQYNIGMIIFVGQFSGGAINEGVVYEEGVPVFAMKAGHWLMEVDNGLVRKFPSSFAEAGGHQQGSILSGSCEYKFMYMCCFWVGLLGVGLIAHDKASLHGLKAHTSL